MFHKHLWYFAKWLVSEWPAVLKVCKPLQQNGLEHTTSLVSRLPASPNQASQCNFIGLYRTAMYGNRAGCCGRKLQFVGRLKCWGAGRWQDNGMQSYIAFRSKHVLSGAHWSGIRKTKNYKRYFCMRIGSISIVHNSNVSRSNKFHWKYSETPKK
jgi:hypothetical protein